MEPNSKPTQKQMLKGLRHRPTYVDVAMIPDKKVKFPSRAYKTIMESPEFNQMVGVPTMDAIEDQEIRNIQERQKEDLIKEKAIKSSDMGEKEYKAEATQTGSTTAYFDMAIGDDAPMEEDEQHIAEEIHGRKEQKSNKRGVLKDMLRNRLKVIRTTVDRFIPTPKPDANDASTQTATKAAGPSMETQTEPFEQKEPNPIQINTKVKTKVKEEKVKKERKKRENEGGSQRGPQR